jgi:hypothetical protein
MVRKFLAVAAVAAFIAVPARAAVVLDQSNRITITTPDNQLIQGIGGQFDRRQAQVVTAGKSGTLTRIDLEAGRVPNAPRVPNNLVIEILHGGAASLPVGPGASPFVVLGSTVPGRNVVDQSKYVTLDVSGLGFHVIERAAVQNLCLCPVADQCVALRPVVRRAGRHRWRRQPDRRHQLRLCRRKELHHRQQRQPAVAGIYDRGFRTYVDAVPELAVWSLMIANFGLVGAGMRRQGRVVAA